MMVKYSLFFCLVFLLVNCSNSERNDISNHSNTSAEIKIPAHLEGIENLKVFNDFNPIQQVAFQKEVSYGEIYLKLMTPQLGFGAEVAVDGQGKVYLSDKGERTVLVYDEEGNLIQKVGRDGRGPGEFESLAAIDVNENHLFVFDSNLSRISMFDTQNFELIASLSIDGKSWGDKVKAKYDMPRTMLVLDNGMFLISVLEEKEEGIMYQGYYKMDASGDIVSLKITETQNLKGHIGSTKAGHSAGIKLPFSAQGKIKVSPNGKIYHINTGEFLIKTYNQEGKVERAVYYPFEKDVLEEQEVLDEYHPNMHRVFDSVEYPDTWPALEHLVIDSENKMWVSTIVDDKEIRKWYILKESGEMLATFTWPRDSEIITVRNGKLYAEEKDPETEAKVVVSYNIEYSDI